MPGKRATSRVERAIVLLTALKPDRMGAERARLLNKEQRYPFVVSQSVTEIRFPAYYTPPTKRQKTFALSALVPSFERDRPPGGPPLVTPQLNGGPARRAVNEIYFGTADDALLLPIRTVYHFDTCAILHIYL